MAEESGEQNQNKGLGNNDKKITDQERSIKSSSEVPLDKGKLTFPGAASRLERVLAEDPEKEAEARIAAEQLKEANRKNLRDAILRITQPYYEVLRATAESGDAIPNKKKNPDSWTIKWEDTNDDIRKVSALVIDKHGFKYNNPRSYRLELSRDKKKFGVIEVTCGEGSITEVGIVSEEEKPDLLSKCLQSASFTQKTAYDEFIQQQLEGVPGEFTSVAPLVVLHVVDNPRIDFVRWNSDYLWDAFKPKRESTFKYNPYSNQFERKLSEKQLAKQNGKLESKDTVSVAHYLNMLSSALHLLPAEQAA